MDSHYDRLPSFTELTTFLFSCMFFVVLGSMVALRFYQAASFTFFQDHLFSKSWVPELHQSAVDFYASRGMARHYVGALSDTPRRASHLLPLPIHKQAIPIPKPFTDASWKTLTVKSGENLKFVFKRAEIDDSDYRAILQLPAAKSIFKNLRPNQTIQLIVNSSHHLERLVYDIDLIQYLELARVHGQLTAAIVERELQKTFQMTHGTIQSSLYVAMRSNRLPPQFFAVLTNTLGWKIDFAHHMRPGDRYKLIYEKYYVGDKPVKVGNLIAAEIATRSHVYQMVRYQDKRGRVEYYFPNGQNVRNAFLRYPVQYKRISSPFNTQRMHPLLQIVRPHLGVDFAAVYGTPIKAAGDGRVVFCGRKGGYGKVVVLQHNQKYTTLYAHLSRFSKGMYVNRYVSQGDVIGYVGQSGFATGPHLHYEFHVNDIPRNPLTVSLASARSVPANERTQFMAYARVMVEKLKTA